LEQAWCLIKSRTLGPFVRRV